MAANPFGAHQVGIHIADYMAYRMRPAMTLLGVPVDDSIRRSNAPARPHPAALRRIFKRCGHDQAIRLLEILCGRLRHTSVQVEDIVFLGLKARLAKMSLYLYEHSSSEHRKN